MKHAAIIILATLLFGCSSSNRYLPQHEFPTRAEAQKLATSAQKLQREPQDSGAKRVNQWALIGALPTVAGESATVGDSPWSVALATLAQASGQHRVTEQSMCFARQFGHFVQSEGSVPFDSLENFMAARCGATGLARSWAALAFDNTEDIDATWATNQAAIEQWAKARIQKMTEPMSVGVTAYKRANKVVFVLTNERRGLDFQAVNMQVSGNSVVLRGTSSFAKTDSVSAVVTKGEFGVGKCVRDSRVNYPDFSFTCEIDPADSYAYVDFARGTEGRLLSTFTSRVMVSGSSLPAEYIAPAIKRAIDAMPKSSSPDLSEVPSPTTQPDLSPRPLVPSGGGNFEQEVFRIINHLRAQVQLAPLVYEEAQSAFNRKMVPYFIASADRDAEEENQAAWAVMAGWEVNQFIVNGSFQSLSGNTNPSEFVDTMLESAHGRALVLGPEVSAIAIGTEIRGDQAAVIVSTFDFMPKADFNNRVAEALRDLNRARAQRNLPPLKESIKLRGIARELAGRIQSNDIELDDAGSKLADQYVRKYNKSCRYWMFVANEFDDMKFDPAIVGTKKGRVSMVVAPYRPEGYPWGFYAVIIVVEQD